MNIRIFTFLTAIALAFSSSATPKESLTSPFDRTPEKAGGIYYAYEENIPPLDSLVSIPDGYTPVYISHYGRHGSRWPVKDRIYKVASDFFQREQLKENITPEGKKIWKMVSLCAGNYQGHRGELTPRGERQHRAIARRMANTFPSLFTDGKTVEARSSIEPRCIMSMTYFTDEISNTSPEAKIHIHATPGDMDFIHHKNPEADLVNSETAPWRWIFDEYRDSVSNLPRLSRFLFKEIPDSDSIPLFTRCLYDIAVSVQNIDSLDAPLLDIFSPEELSGLWKAANYIQYVGNANSPVGEYVGPRTATALLNEIVTRADEMLESGEVSVDLRFGHDTDLLRLLSLIKMEGASLEADNPGDAARGWKNYRLSPMGANLQLVFFRNPKGETILLPLHNERPVAISDVPQQYPGFYDWDLLKIYLQELINHQDSI